MLVEGRLGLVQQKCMRNLVCDIAVAPCRGMSVVVDDHAVRASEHGRGRERFGLNVEHMQDAWRFSSQFGESEHDAKGQYLYFFCVGRHQRRNDCQQPYILAETVEQAVERYYRYVRLPENVQDTIRAGLRAELDKQRQQAQPEIAWAKRRVVELEDQRRRLARGVVTGAIPEDLAAEEQDRIRSELEGAGRVLATAEVIYGRIEDTLNLALALVGRCDELYRRGGAQVRRLSNQFFFEKLLVDDEEIAGAVHAEPRGSALRRAPRLAIIARRDRHPTSCASRPARPTEHAIRRRGTPCCGC
jgi:hypothetical protein